MEENLLRMSSMISGKWMELRGSSPFPTIRNKMVWRKGRTDLSWKLWKPWSMTKIFQCTYGQKQHEKQYMFRIESLIVLLGIKIQKKCFRWKTRGKSSKYFWLYCIHSYSQGEKIKVRSFMKERIAHRI